MSGKTFTLALILAGFVAVPLAVAVSQEGTTDEEIAEASLTPADIPEGARERPNPYARDPKSIEQGKLVFSSQCVMCHGADGRGTGDLVERLKLDIPDFTDAAWQKEWTDGGFFYVVDNGHGHMPGQQGRFEDDLKWHLVNYVRTFARR